MPDDYSRIFLLSHMRAYTSLAGHILGSHPRINGYFELHRSYENSSDLARQLEVFQQYETLKPHSHYLFDKLLHNDYRLNPERLGGARVKILVALLEPEQTIKSIVDLFSKKASEDLYASPAGAAEYYISRIKALADFCRRVDHACYYYDAALFKSAPEILLPGLTDWLGLDSPLSERYQLFSQTGRAGKGDSSDLIRSGRIEKTKNDYSHIHIPEEVLTTAQAVYRDCRSNVIDHAEDALTRRSQASRSLR